MNQAATATATATATAKEVAFFAAVLPMNLK